MTKITLQAFIRQHASQLPDSSTALLDVEILLRHVLDMTREQLLMQRELLISKKHLQEFKQLFQRLSQGEPVAYIIGEKEFWSLPFKVNQSTLIPRPETECLIEYVLQHYESESCIDCLDLGTGSGVIPIVLAKERPNWRIDAVDICPQALLVAKENQQRLGLSQINFFQSDWYDKVTETYDLIISNPPYVEPHSKLLEALHFEPQTALVARDEGYADLKHIIELSHHYLKPLGRLVVEHGYQQSDTVAKLFLDAGFKSVDVVKDYAGIKRICSGLLCNLDSMH